MVEEKWSGIYIVSGDVLPIQIIDSRRLSGEENIWLKSLSKEHDWLTIARIDKEINKKGKTARLKAYLYTIISANPEAAEEAMKMGRKFDEVMENTGLAAKWEARGVEKKAAEIAGNMLKNGFSVEQTAALSGLDVVKVKALIKGQN
jgi:hypothetical protein